MPKVIKCDISRYPQKFPINKRSEETGDSLLSLLSNALDQLDDTVQVMLYTDNPNNPLCDMFVTYCVTHAADVYVYDTFTQDNVFIPAVMGAPKGFERSTHRTVKGRRITIPPVNSRYAQVAPSLYNYKPTRNPLLRRACEYANDKPTLTYAILKREHARLYTEQQRAREQYMLEVDIQQALRDQPFDLNDDALVHFQLLLKGTLRKRCPLYYSMYNIDVSPVDPNSSRFLDSLAFVWADAYDIAINTTADKMHLAYLIAEGIEPDYEQLHMKELRLMGSLR